MDTLISARIAELLQKLSTGSLGALERFWQDVEKTGTPLVEELDEHECLVTFLWRGQEDTKAVSVFGEILAGALTPMSQIEGTDAWYKTCVAPRDSCSLYLFAVNPPEHRRWPEIDLRLDPLNPKIYTCPTDKDYPDRCFLLRRTESLLELPDYSPSQWLNRRPDVSKGDLVEHQFTSAVLGNTRRIWVYTPAGHSDQPHKLAVFTDGWEYAHLMQTTTILDNLIGEGKIAPTYAVFVDSVDRMSELNCNAAYLQFLTEELLAFVRSRHGMATSAEDTLIAGYSMGGLNALFAAVTRPDVFGRVLSQSGWFGVADDAEAEGAIFPLIREYSGAPARVYLELGCFETWDPIRVSSRKMRALLQQKRFDVSYRDFPGGHVFTDWRDSLGAALLTMLGR